MFAFAKNFMVFLVSLKSFYVMPSTNTFPVPARQTGLGQKAIFKELQQIKMFRNRIAHHEPICFDATGRKSMVYAQANYALILKYLTFLGYDKNHLFFGLDVLPESVMNKIDAL